MIDFDIASFLEGLAREGGVRLILFDETGRQLTRMMTLSEFLVLLRDAHRRVDPAILPPMDRPSPMG